MIPHELYILRHGETVWNAEDRLQGWANSPLTPLGEVHAARQFEILRSRDLKGFTAYASPSGRAVQTAAIAAAPLLHEVHTDARLREIGVGAWTGWRRADCPVQGGEFLDLYRQAPDGEGFAALEARCRAFLAELAGPAVLVTHGLTSRMLRSLIVGQDALSITEAGGGQGVVWHVRNGAQNLLT